MPDPPRSPLLTPAFFAPGGKPASIPTIARRLLGCVLQHGEVALRITEVEAYGGPEDTASHARMGRTPRNGPMWGDPGHAYIYLVYGLHRLLNVTAAAKGTSKAGAVLIRAAEPLRGVPQIVRRRGGRTGPSSLAGPGKVSQALGVTLAQSGDSLLVPGGLELREGPPPPTVRVGPRVGIDYASPADRDVLWRFADGSSLWVSQPRSLRPEPPCPRDRTTPPKPSPKGSG